MGVFVIVDHADALREMSVEKYLLGELTGTPRDSFEEHLFECELCAADLKSGVAFAEAARLELVETHDTARAQGKSRETSGDREASRGWFDWLLRPQWMAPALAACLLLIGYQNVFKMPGLHHQLAQAESPHIVNSLTLASGTMRSGGLPVGVVPDKGVLLLSVDLPPQQTVYSSYLCSLFAPSGALMWKGSVSATPSRDSLQISVPAVSTQAGENTLLVQGVRQSDASGATLDDLVKHSFVLKVQK